MLNFESLKKQYEYKQPGNTVKAPTIQKPKVSAPVITIPGGSFNVPRAEETHVKDEEAKRESIISKIIGLNGIETKPGIEGLSKGLTAMELTRPGTGRILSRQNPELAKQAAQDTEKFFEKNPGYAGFMENFNPLPVKDQLAETLGQPINTAAAEDTTAYKVGSTLGLMGQFAAGYAGFGGGAVSGARTIAPKLITGLEKAGAKVVSGLPRVGAEAAEQFGKSAAESLIKDIAIGAPLNINQAIVKDDLQGKEAVKSIAINTGLDLILGGAMEAVPIILKSGKRLRSKADFDQLPAAEKDEAAERINALYEEAQKRNTARGKNTEDLGTLYTPEKGPAMKQPFAGLLEGPTSANNSDIARNALSQNPQEDAFLQWRKENFGGAFGKVSPQDEQALRELFSETTQPNYKAAVGAKEVPNTIRPDEVAGRTVKAPEIIKQEQPTIIDPLKQPEPTTTQMKKDIPTENTAQTIADGSRVKAADRGNIGIVESKNADGTYNVKFVSQEGFTATKKFKADELEDLSPKPKEKIPDKDFDSKVSNFMNDEVNGTGGYGTVTAKTETGTHAKVITGKGVTPSKDIFRNSEAAFRNSKAGYMAFKREILDPILDSKGTYSKEVKTKMDDLYQKVVKDLGIKKGSKESAAIQRIGEGEKQVKVPVTEDASGTKRVPYTMEDLQAEFNYRAANGKMAWENIVEAEKYVRKTYDDYVDKINDAMKRIYPNVEEEIAKIDKKISLTTDPSERAELFRQREDAIVGKRLQKRKDYFRHFQEQQQGLMVGLDNIINGATNIDPRLVGISEFTKPKSMWTGFMQRRSGEEIYIEDALEGLLQYIPQAEYKINIEPTIPILRGMIRDLQEETVTTRNANKFIDQLMRFTNDLAGKTNQIDRMPQLLFGDEQGRKYLNALSTVSNRMRTNAVMGNVNTMIAQFFNLPNAVGYIKNPADLTTGFAQAVKAAAGEQKSRELLQKSDFLRERYLDRSIRRFDEKVLNKAENFFAWTMEAGDKAIADGTWLSAYNQAIRKGQNEQEAIRMADDITRKAIAGRGIGEMPLSQKAKMTKLFVPFQVEVRNAVNVLKDLGTQKDVLGIAGIFATSFLMNEMLKASTGREIGFNPIGILKETYKESKEQGMTNMETTGNIAGRVGGNLLSNFPGGGYIANIAIPDDITKDKIFGQEDPSRFGTGNIAMQTLLTPVWDAVTGENIDLIKPLTASLPKFGGKQIERGIRGLQDMAMLPKETINLVEPPRIETQEFPASYSNTGRLRFPIEPTAQNYITAPLLGSFATPEGKEYINTDGKALSEERTAVVKNLKESYGIEPKLSIEIIERAKQFETRKDSKGNSIPGTKKQKILNYLDDQDLTIVQQKAIAEALNIKYERRK